MSDVLIPKEQLTPYQRWELPSFDHHQQREMLAQKLPTAAEIEAIQQQAHAEGYQLGHEEGFQTGYAEGSKKAADEVQRLHTLVSALTEQVDDQVAQQLLDLSLELARQMLHQTLAVKPEMVLDVVREAIGLLPHFTPGAHVLLHPDDAVLVRERMGEQLTHSGWKIFEDARIQRGGARIETANSQIDATLDTRWKRVIATLGQDSSWIQE